MLFAVLIPAPAALGLEVITSVAPLTDIVRQVAGGRATVIGLVPEGVNSHTFEPAPSSARLLAAADLIIVNGLDLELPILSLAQRVKRAGTPIVKLGNQAIGREAWLFDFSFPEAAGHPNPHLWPDAALAARYAEITRDALIAADPAGTPVYLVAAGRYLNRLTELDLAIFGCVASIPPANRKLVTYHDSYAYFARRYGMTVIGALQPADFAEPSAREVAAMIRQIRGEKVPAIFGSAVFPSPILAQIAREAGVIYVDSLRDDDLPGEPGDPGHSYLGMMAANLRAITGALGGDARCMDRITP